MKQDVAAMRHAFDEAFTRPAVVDRPATARLLELHLAGATCLVPAADVAGVVRCAVLAAVPGSRRHVLGVVAVRGALVAAVDLSAALGRGAGPDAAPVWVVRCAADPTVGLVVDRVGALVDVPVSDVVAVASPSTPLLPRIARGAEPRAVVDVAALLAELHRVHP